MPRPCRWWSGRACRSTSLACQPHASREELLLHGEVRVREDRALGLARRAARVELQRGVVAAWLGADGERRLPARRASAGDDAAIGSEERRPGRRVRTTR